MKVPEIQRDKGEMREDEQCLPGCRERAEGCVLQPPRSVRAVPGPPAVPGLLLPSRGSAVPGGACGARGSVLGLRCSEIPPETSTEQRNLQRLRVNITRARPGVLLRLWVNSEPTGSDHLAAHTQIFQLKVQNNVRANNCSRELSQN